MINLGYLKEKRIEKNMSLDEIAKILGYSAAYGYWKVENGLVRLKAEHIIKLQKILDLELNKLLKEDYINVGN